MRIQHNVTAMNSHRMYTINSGNMAKNVEKLSSGYKINRAGDDAAGLAISEKMRGQIRGLTMASKNSLDAISLIQTAEGALQSTQDILQRMRELSVQSASDTNMDAVDREALNMEYQQLIKEIDDVADKTEFNKKKLINGDLDGSTGGGGTTAIIQIGANKGDTLSINIASMSSGSLGEYDAATATFDLDTGKISSVPTGASTLASSAVSSQADAADAIAIVDGALNMVSMLRAALGAKQNRLEFKIQNLDNSAENLQAAESRIRDTDMAKEMTAFIKNNILFQASTAMLAQANSLPQGVLQLLG